MKRILSILSRGIAAALLIFGTLATPALASPTTAPSDAAANFQNNLIQARQFHWTSVHLPGRSSARQSITAWQVTRGSWAGETLDGLSVVLVQSTFDSNAGKRLVNCYVSSQATLAQRDALVSAFMSNLAGSLPTIDPSSMRIEPAVITLEVDGQTITLHLGLIS